MAKTSNVTWLDEPEAKDYPAALSYLTLVFDPSQAKTYLDQLRTAPISEFKAKDIFRASGLSVYVFNEDAVVPCKVV